MDVRPEQSPSRPAVEDLGDLTELREEVTELRARLDAFERILQLRDAADALPSSRISGQAAPTTPLPPTYEVAADQLLPAQDGFYQLEWGPEGAFRWTGPGEAVHFEAWVDRSAALKATLRLFHFGTPANAKDLALEVDGSRYPLNRVGEGKILQAEGIAARERDGPTRFTLHIPHLHSPSAAHGAADKRTLGVAFQRLRVEPA